MALRARKVSGAFEKRTPGRGHWVVFLGKTLYSHGASLRPGVNVGVTLRWSSIPIQRGEEILLVASCYRNRDKPQPNGPLGSYANMFLPRPLM